MKDVTTLNGGWEEGTKVEEVGGWEEENNLKQNFKKGGLRMVSHSY